MNHSSAAERKADGGSERANSAAPRPGVVASGAPPVAGSTPFVSGGRSTSAPPTGAPGRLATDAFAVADTVPLEVPSAAPAPHAGAAFLADIGKPWVAPTRQERVLLVLRLQGKALATERFEAAAIGVVNELAAIFRASRVSLGFFQGERAEIRAISGASSPRRDSDIVRDLSAAMVEAADQRASVVHPRIPGKTPRIALAQANLCSRHGASAVCTVPLVAAGEIVGALVIERDKDRVFERAEVGLFEQVATFLAPILDLKRRADLPLGSRLIESMAEGRRRLLGPRARAWPIVIAVTLATLAGAAFVPADHRVTAPARLEGATQRVLAAPIDGYIAKVHARPGEFVLDGQPLVELDDKELSLERRKWEAEAAQIEKQYSEALAKEDRPQIMIQQAKLLQAKTQIGVIEEQLERIRLKAPYDGIVIEGDLTQSLGAPVKRGDVLLTVAPRGQYRVSVEVDERDIGFVRAGQKGRLVLAALPEGSAEIDVRRVTPIATAKDGRNYFVVEADIAQPAAAMQPGLEGVAKIEVGQRGLLWVIGHRFADWLRITLWTWRV